jgi:hypothetical protein
MAKKNDLELIKQALSAGRLDVPDKTTGYHRSLYARCPRDKSASLVHRIDRSAEEGITRVVFRCPICGKQFDVTPEKMFLK